MKRPMLASLGVAVLIAAIPATARSQQLAAVREQSAVAPSDGGAQPTPPAPVFQQARSQAPGVATRRRRASVVGYIDDSTIESKVRFRFDIADGTTVPDRAEFFYAKCGCYRDIPVRHQLYDSQAPGPRPGAANNINYRQLYLEGEVAVDTRVSFFGQVPLRWLQPQSFVTGTGSFANQSGLSDLRGGVKLGLLDSASQHALTAKVQVYFPTGDSARGLGTNHTSVEPSMLLRQELSPTVSLESQAGVWLPIGGSSPLPTTTSKHFAGRVFYYGFGPSVTVYETDRLHVAPVVELVGWRVLAGNQTAPVDDAAGINIVNIKFGARVTYDAGSFYVGYGRALTDASWYDDVLRFEYRYTF